MLVSITKAELDVLQALQSLAAAYDRRDDDNARTLVANEHTTFSVEAMERILQYAKTGFFQHVNLRDPINLEIYRFMHGSPDSLHQLADYYRQFAQQVEDADHVAKNSLHELRFMPEA